MPSGEWRSIGSSFNVPVYDNRTLCFLPRAQFVCLSSVRLSIHHTCEPRPNVSRYWNTISTIRYCDVWGFFTPNFIVEVFFTWQFQLLQYRTLLDLLISKREILDISRRWNLQWVAFAWLTEAECIACLVCTALLASCSDSYKFTLSAMLTCLFFLTGFNQLHTVTQTISFAHPCLTVFVTTAIKPHSPHRPITA